jgi:hypothetical protein
MVMIRLRDLLTETDVKKDTPYKSGDTYISKDEAKRIYDYMGYDFDFNQFVLGMNVELEHQDITDGSLVKTAMIAAAHLKEVPDYYTKLKQHVEPNKTKNEDGAPTGGIGLNLPGGYINAAPKPKDVKKMRTQLNKEKRHD